jgi:uncharacterized protein (TIGR02147 family)
MSYEHEKSIDSKYSLQYICNKCDIPSKGHLSDVMNGRRKLKSSYIDCIFKVLKFTEPQREVLRILSQLERAKTNEEKELFIKEVYNARKRLNIQKRRLKSGDYNPFIFVKAFCALGIQNLLPKLESISQVINESVDNTRKALDQLIEQGFLTIEGDYYIYSKNLSEVVFSEGDSEQFQLKHIEIATSRALERLPDMFIYNDETYFESTTLSVSKSEYSVFLKKLKTFISKNISELESDWADDIAHFNFLIYPENSCNSNS